MLRLVVIVVLVVAAFFLLFYTRKDEGSAVQTVTVQAAATDTAKANVKPVLYIASPANPHWQALLSDYENFLQRALDKNQAPGVAVAIVQDSSVIYASGLGLRDVDTQTPVDVHTVFRLGSVSKSFAGVLTARLVQEGILRWSDKVIDYVPGFRLKLQASTDSLTLAHLLSHTSGLPYHAFTDRVDDGAHFDTLVYHLRDLSLTGPPGKIYSYQNVAFSIISKVIESATGKSYEQVMIEKIFMPLQMLESSLNYEALLSTPDKASPHQRTRKGWRSLAISPTYYNVGPAGGVNASIGDMARWLKTLTNPYDTLLSPTSKGEMFSPQVKAIARNRHFRKWKRSRGSYYAHGWRVLTFKDDTVNYHGGYVNGFRSEVAVKPNDRLGIAVLVNSPGPLADHAIPEFLRLYELYRVRIQSWEMEQPKPLPASE